MVREWIDLLERCLRKEEGTVMVGEKKRGEAGAEIGVGREGIGGITMAKRGRIEDIDPAIDLIADR